MTFPKIVFLDRDGTINEEVNYLHRPEDFRFVPGVPEALRRLHEAGYLLIVITNQAGIARGYYTEADCKNLNRYMAEKLAEQGAVLTAAYYCPHHPIHGIGKYHKDCNCRKPKDGLMLQALADILSELPEWKALLPAKPLIRSPLRHPPGTVAPGAPIAKLSLSPARQSPTSNFSMCPVDFYQSTLTLSAEQLQQLRQWKAEKFAALAAEASVGPYKDGFAARKASDTLATEASVWPSGLYMIGDKRSDTQAGHNFGIRSILVGSGYGREEKAKAMPGDYDLYFDTLGEAAEWILKQEQ